MTGSQLRYLRQSRLQLSLRQLARLARCHFTSLHRWETTQDRIPDRVQLRIHMLLQYSPVRLCQHCGGTGVEMRTEQTARRLP